MGAHAVQWAAPRRGRLSVRQRLLLGAAAAAFPDADYLAFLVNPLRFLADWHQGPTHSIALLPLWGALVGGAFCALARRRDALGEAVAISCLGVATHIALDLITVYGTKVLYPLSFRPFSLGTTFVVDPLFSALVCVSLALSVRTGLRRWAAAGLVLLCAYVGWQETLKRQALRSAAEAARSAGIETERLEALPQPFSPFNWKLIAVQGSQSHIAYINLAGHPPLLPQWQSLAPLYVMAQAYAAPERIVWQPRPVFGDDPGIKEIARQLWARSDFTAFRRFAAYPALSRVDTLTGPGSPPACIWFTDLRYDMPAFPDTFRYGYCREAPQAPWRLHRLRYLTEGKRQRLE